MRNSQSGERGRRETHGVCACGVRANNGDEIRQTDVPDAITPNRVRKPVIPVKAGIQLLCAACLASGSGAGDKPPRYRCGVGILGWRECQESRASNAVIPAQAGIHLRAQRRSRPERGTSPRSTVRRERLPAPPIRAVSSLPNCCACYAHTGWSADQRLKFSVEEAAKFRGRASSHIWVHVVESRSSDSGLARLRAANPGKTGRPVG